MAGYQYRPELKKPRALGGIDFGNPALAPMVRMVVQNLRRTTRAWTPPEGISFRAISVLSKDGECIECFVVEPKDDSSLPGMLYCHGGGFFLPVEAPALELAAVYAQKLRVRVFLPEYRLLPDHPYPAPLQDCRAVWDEMAAQANRHHLNGRILLYGESAGGSLAAGLVQQLRDEGKPSPCGQVLVYPALDDRSEKYPSTERYSGAVWTKRANTQMWSGYLKNGFQGPEGHAVPLRGTDFTGLPPAYIEPQEIDLLRDEGAAYGERLREAGISVKMNMIQKTFTEDLFDRQQVKNEGQLPKYYVHDCHPAIIDRAAFQRVQEELARRSSLRKTSSKAKTEQTVSDEEIPADPCMGAEDPAPIQDTPQIPYQQM